MTECECFSSGIRVVSCNRAVRWNRVFVSYVLSFGCRFVPPGHEYLLEKVDICFWKRLNLLVGFLDRSLKSLLHVSCALTHTTCCPLVSFFKK